MAPPAGEATALSIALALIVLLAMLGLLVGSAIVLLKLVRAVFSTPAAAGQQTPRRASPSPARVAGGMVGAAEHQPRTAAPSSEGERVESEPARLALWRSRQLMRLGVHPVNAIEAALCGVDAAGVRLLVTRGCRPELTVAILLPDAPAERLARSPAEATDRRILARPWPGGSPLALHRGPFRAEPPPTMKT